MNKYEEGSKCQGKNDSEEVQAKMFPPKQKNLTSDK